MKKIEKVKRKKKGKKRVKKEKRNRKRGEKKKKREGWREREKLVITCIAAVAKDSSGNEAIII